MNTKHTPGPWKHQGVAAYANGATIAVATGLHSIATIQERLAEQEANAKLIAAAPELLAALQTLCEDVGQIDLCNAPEYALAAIAAATA